MNFFLQNYLSSKQNIICYCISEPLATCFCIAETFFLVFLDILRLCVVNKLEIYFLSSLLTV